MTGKRKKSGNKLEMRFAISKKTDECIKEAAEELGMKKTDVGFVALMEYLRRYDLDG